MCSLRPAPFSYLCVRVRILCVLKIVCGWANKPDCCHTPAVVSIFTDSAAWVTVLLRSTAPLQLSDVPCTIYRPSLITVLCTSYRPSLFDVPCTSYRPSLIPVLCTGYRPSVFTVLCTSYRPSLITVLCTGYRPSLFTVLCTSCHPSFFNVLCTSYRPSLFIENTDLVPFHKGPSFWQHQLIVILRSLKWQGVRPWLNWSPFFHFPQPASFSWPSCFSFLNAT